ncbi:MAG TPA: ATP-binding protein [Solirubrobacterales bacterium]|nr:ATP-binding protein [Solirubrobacterales bacterium]
MAFFNRKDELAALSERLRSDRGEYFVLYGRRRVGKSELLRHFGESCRQFYFEASAGSRRDQLDDLGAELSQFSGRALYAEQPLSNWRAAFAAFSELLEGGQTMIVLDEFQFIARQEPEIGSLLNRFVSEHGDNPDLFLCLSGSDISFFERKVVGYGATTYGRRTGSLRLLPFHWREIGAFVPDWSIEGRIRAWAVFGGIPYYLKEIDPAESLPETIRRAILYPDGLLREEPRFLLSQESRLREQATYMSCLRAIAGGDTRLNEIAQRVGRSAPEARAFLEVLEEMGLVERRYPVTRTSGRKVSYAIVDPFLRFWFRFVAPRESRLATRRDADRYLEESVMPELDKFVSEDAFERICQDWLGDQLGAAEVGWWWGSIRRRQNGKLRNSTYEADAVAVDADGRVMALGSCKWPGAGNNRHLHEAGELDKLETIREELEAPDAALYFFDRVGFSPRLQELASEREDVHLVSVGELEPAARM